MPQSRRFGGLTCAPRLLYNTPMRPDAIRFYGSFFALALLLMAQQAVAMDAVVPPSATAGAMAQVASPQAMADYRRKLKEYLEARAAFDQEAGA